MGDGLIPIVLLFVIIPAFLLFGSYLCSLGGRDLQRMYTIARSESQLISDLANRTGPVEITGTAIPSEDQETVTGIFSGVECLVYTYSAQAPTGSGPPDAPRGEDGKFDVVDEGVEYTNFVVEDDTGRVLIDPAGASFTLTPEYFSNAPLSKTPEHLEEYMHQNRETRPPKIFLHPVISHIVKNHNRFVERRLDIGDTVYLTGYVRETAGWDHDDDICIGDGPEAVEFKIYDTPKRRTVWRYGVFGLGKVVVGVILISAMSLLLYDNLMALT